MNISKATRQELYATARHLSAKTKRDLKLPLLVPAFLQDPAIAESQPHFGLDENFEVRWEPGLADGPTSARFAIVDYNSDTGILEPMATWDDDNRCFCLPNGAPVVTDTDSPQFHQVNVWAHLQRAIDFYERPEGLGRQIPFGFEGNRLIVLPHAGYGKNAFYDRSSKSLQFYFFDDISGDTPQRVYTCLSADIVAHEFGHAVLDGVRPALHESVLVETAAFHEFMGDITAILLSLENEPFRHALINSVDGELTGENALSQLAEEFGSAISNKPYLRSASNSLTMTTLPLGAGHHETSQVLTGALFDLLINLVGHYRHRREHDSDREVFSHATKRIRRLVIQALDLLPPVDVTFNDFAMSVFRADTLVNPVDPHEVRSLIAEVFHDRGIISDTERNDVTLENYVYSRPRINVFHAVDIFSRSKAAAYQFLHDNRSVFHIPAHRDFIISDLYDSRKYARQNRRLPKQTVITYLWRQELQLSGDQFGAYDGQMTSLLCGGTLVVDDSGNIEHWTLKPGTELVDTEYHEHGLERLATYLNALEKRIQSGQIGSEIGGAVGLLASQIPPVQAEKIGDEVRFRLSPHIGLFEDDHHQYGGPQWQLSS